MKLKIWLAGTMVLILMLGIIGVIAGNMIKENRIVKQIELGHQYFSQGDFEKSVLAFDKAIELDPINIQARLGLAEVYAATDRIEESEAVIREAIIINPQQHEPYIALAQLLNDLGRLEEALKVLTVQGFFNELTTGITLNQNYLTLPIAATAKLDATVISATVSEEIILWSSSNPGIVEVSSDGVVTAVAHGTATITATTHDGSKSAICFVSVGVSVSEADLVWDTDSGAVILQPGQSLEFINTISEIIMLMSDHKCDHSIYREGGYSLADLSHQRENFPARVLPGQRAVVTNPNTESIRITADSEHFSPTLSARPALKVAILQPGQSIEFTSPGGQDFFAWATGTYHYVTYDTEGKGIGLTHNRPRNHGIGGRLVDCRYVITNADNEPIWVYSGFDVFDPVFIEEKALEIITLEPGQSMDLVNSSEFPLRYHTTDGSSYRELKPNEQIVLTNSNSETILVYWPSEQLN